MTVHLFRRLILACIIGSMICGLTLSGCGPTYPKETLKESIIRICRNEYSLDVKVQTVGKTIAIYVPLPGLIDFTFSVTKEASEKINNVILSVSRATLSTDAKFDFYCIIAHDVRIPEIQIVIIKSVDDVKRFLLNDISRGEYSKRMLIDIRMNPQSQREQSIKEVFEKMTVDRKWQEQVMNDFFRAQPAVLDDIGYWNGRFYIKNISLAEFLADQIGSRVRMEFKEGKELSQRFLIKSARGSYIYMRAEPHFKIEVSADPKSFKELGGEEISDEIFHVAAKVAYQVLHGYKFEDFNYVEVIDQSSGKTLKVVKEDLKKFKARKGKIEDIIDVGAY